MKQRVAVLALLPLLLLRAWAHDSPGPDNEGEANLLLTFKAGISNWAEAAAARQLQGWTSCDIDPDCLPVCNWSGVECNPYLTQTGNYVTALRLPCRAGCTVPFRGDLRPGIHRLQHLTYLYLDGNALSGTLPPQWGEPHGFPTLLEFNLNDNQLTGSMPEVWSVGPAFETLADLQLAGNRLSGPFPAGFAVTNTSFWSLMSFNFANNRLTGSLPSYINGMITMSIVRLENNLFTGTLPPDWGTQGYFWNSSYNSTQALEYLSLHGNRLTGSLPPEWAAPGSFTVLKQLTLSDNPGLVGSLPPAWGAHPEALPALEDLNVSNTGLSGPLPPWGPHPRRLRALTIFGNNFDGLIPDSWAQFGNLQDVIATPGNPALCPAAPLGASFSVCSAHDPLCINSLPTDTEACTALAPVTPSSTSSFPVAAVAAPLAVAAALAVVVAGLLWRRRTRRRSADLASARAKADLPVQDEEAGGVLALRSKQGGSAPSGPGAGAAAATVTPPGGWQAATHAGTVGDWLPGLSLQGSRSAELEALPSGSTPRGSGGAPPFPSQLPQLHLTPAGGPLPRHPSTGGSSSSEAQTSGHASADGGWAPALRGAGGSALQLSDWEIRPDEIEILKHADGTDWQLGCGGFGTVYKALRNGVTPVAVKVLGSASSDHVLKSMSDADFAHEISILRACRDTNILQFQGACRQGSRLLLVTEFMEGGNLAHNLRAKKVSWYRKGKKIAVDVARALVYLHNRRILHLDIKSANVLLTRDGTAKVGDVGMAKVMAGDYVSGVLGTLAWSAPELLMGQRCGAKADVYSFGVLLWEICCSGEVPQRGQLRDPIVPDECPADVVSLLHRCLSPDPAARPTATQLVEVLQAAEGAPSPGLHPPCKASALPPFAPSPPDALSPAPSAPAPPTRSAADSTAQAGSARGSQDLARRASPDSQSSGDADTSPRAPPPPALDPELRVGQRPAQQEGEASGAGQGPALPRVRQYTSAGRAITFVAARAAPEGPPRLVPDAAAAPGAAAAPAPSARHASQSSLEDRLVSELAEELSREAAHGGEASGGGGVPGAAASHDGPAVAAADDGVGGLQRRLVLLANGQRSSPFARPPPGGAPSAAAAAPASSHLRVSPFSRQPASAAATAVAHEGPALGPQPSPSPDGGS